MQLTKRAGSPYYQYAFTLKGRRFRGSTKESAKRAAEIAAYKIYNESSQLPSVTDGWRITECLGTYWTEHGQHQRSADFIWGKLSIIDRLLDTKIKMADLTNSDLLDFRARRKGEGIGQSTINRDLAILKAAINHAVDLHAQKAPAIAWRKLRYGESEYRIRFLSIDEFEALTEAADEDMAFAIMAAVTTGLRKTSMIDIKWHQVDLAGRSITIPKGKGKRPHIVRITEPLLSDLLRRRKRSGFVFTRTNFRKRWEAARSAAGIEDIRWHDLRHTFGSWGRQGGADLLDLKEALDHSSVAVTMRYAHIDPHDSITAFERAAGKLTQSLTQSGKKRA